MADIDRMFRSELAVLAEQPTESDLWALDPPPSSHFTSVFDSPVPAVPFDTAAHNGPSPHTDWGNLSSLGGDHTSILSPPPAEPLQPPPSPHISEHYPSHDDTALGLFPAPNRRLGAPVAPTQPADPLHIPFAAVHPHHPQPTVRLSDISLGTIASTSVPMPLPPGPTVQIPMSASSSGARLSGSPTDSHIPTDPSSDDMDSDDFELAYPSPSDSEFFPSPVSINPAALSASMNPHPARSIRPSRRASRAMTNIPVPIPNLTKKSRGRKVPTSNGEPLYAASRDKTKKGVRMYTCHADDCGKCFVRGEHLKRHIRSIHTDDKPWMCTYENCTRAFSRRDNLNQHLRIHKLQDSD